jgi:Phosphotransferase enzyme family
MLQPVIDELEQAEMRAFSEVNEEEAVLLAGRLRALPELCMALAACAISDTLIHRDLWAPDVILRDKFSGKAPVIFDWSDAAISHPFFDNFCLLWAEKDDAERRDEKEAHLMVWSDIYPHKTVMRAFELAELIAPNYYLVAWRDVELQVPAQSRWELMYLVLKFVRKILEQAI